MISKQIIENKIKNNNHKIEEIIQQGFYRNFSGLNFNILKQDFAEYKTINEFFLDIYKIKVKLIKYNIPKCIEDNLVDKESRYLLLKSNLGLGKFL